MKMGKDCVPDDEDKIRLVPENLLLEIFRYLSVKDRCIAGRVCRQWRRIVKDNSLWRHVNLLDYRLDLTKMWKVLRAHFSPCLLTMRIRGFAHLDSRKRKKASVSDAMLKELAERCPNLWLFHLDDCNTDNLTFRNLPETIKSLHVTNSTWQPRWLKGQADHLPELKTLDLSLSIRVDNFDLEDIAQWTSLKELSLKRCYRVKGSEIEVIAKNLTDLESLNLSGTGIDDLAIHHIARHLKKLKNLFLANCTAMTDSCIATIASGLLSLNNLDISHCGQITMRGLQSLHELRNLKSLSIAMDKQFSNEEIENLQTGFSHEIVISK